MEKLEWELLLREALEMGLTAQEVKEFFESMKNNGIAAGNKNPKLQEVT